METRLPTTTVTTRRTVVWLDALGIALALGGGFVVSWMLANAFLPFFVLIFALGMASAMLVRWGRGWLVAATALWLGMQGVQFVYGVQHGKLANGEWWLDMVMVGLLIYAYAALPALVGATLATRVFRTGRASGRDG